MHINHVELCTTQRLELVDNFIYFMTYDPLIDFFLVSITTQPSCVYYIPIRSFCFKCITKLALVFINSKWPSRILIMCTLQDISFLFCYNFTLSCSHFKTSFNTLPFKHRVFHCTHSAFNSHELLVTYIFCHDDFYRLLHCSQILNRLALAKLAITCTRYST